jgi:hypothetical protein
MMTRAAQAGGQWAGGSRRDARETVCKKLVWISRARSPIGGCPPTK